MNCSKRYTLLSTSASRQKSNECPDLGANGTKRSGVEPPFQLRKLNKIFYGLIDGRASALPPMRYRTYRDVRHTEMPDPQDLGKIGFIRGHVCAWSSDNIYFTSSFWKSIQMSKEPIFTRMTVYNIIKHGHIRVSSAEGEGMLTCPQK